ncbi:competence type IV pilus major pilin ComGC [Armatimonas sp.]|uniref:competence type IV pilus major pilin ComGC n=1 Tax=Armatimonas sp. TaxID=1872638 RepID=UPI00374DC4D4
MRDNVRRAFTLVEIMIVVLIIGILVAIAVPNFVKARESSRSRACIQNLRQIDSAVQQWAITNNIPSTHPNAVIIADLSRDDSGWGPRYLKSMPVCPSGGTYSNPLVNVAPTCTIGASGSPAHVLP